MFAQGSSELTEEHKMDDGRIRRRGFLATAGATVAGVGGLLAGPHAKAAADPRLTVGPIRRVGADGSKYFDLDRRKPARRLEHRGRRLPSP